MLDSGISETRPGTQVLFRWAKWQKEHNFPRQCMTAVFRKEDRTLVVYGYEHNLCIVINRAQLAPKFRDIRKWQQSYAAVKGKLKKAGWSVESEHEEVNYDVH